MIFNDISFVVLMIEHISFQARRSCMNHFDNQYEFNSTKFVIIDVDAENLSWIWILSEFSWKCNDKIDSWTIFWTWSKKWIWLNFDEILLKTSIVNFDWNICENRHLLRCSLFFETWHSFSRSELIVYLNCFNCNCFRKTKMLYLKIDVVKILICCCW